MRHVVGLVLMVLITALISMPAFANHLSGYTAPTGLGASVAGDYVTLTWTLYPSGNFPTACGTPGQEIRIHRQYNSGGFSLRTTVTPTTTTFTDEDLADGTYDYKIQARCNVPGGPGGADTNNLSAFSDTATAVVTSAPACAGPPTVEASASPLLLWPPNGKLVPVTVMGTVTAQSNCSLPGSISYYIVDEYDELSSASPVTVGLDNGNFSFQVSLEASRLGDDRDGRLYMIQLDTVDGGEADIYVTVPHDQRKK